MVREIALFPFRYFDLLSRKWVRARYLATLDDLAARYGAFQVVGPPEIRRAEDAATLSASHLAGGPARG
jgi:hypothetical protein